MDALSRLVESLSGTAGFQPAHDLALRAGAGWKPAVPLFGEPRLAQPFCQPQVIARPALQIKAWELEVSQGQLQTSRWRRGQNGVRLSSAMAQTRP
jgi:hypothetical protein